MRELRILLAMVIVSIVVMASTKLNADQWQIFYQTDFSTDPEWTTNVPSQMYWNSSSSTYHLEVHASSSDYTYVNIPYTPTTDFKLEFDFTMTSLPIATALSFGLGKADMGWDKFSVWTNYGSGSGGNGASVGYNSDTTSGSFPDPYDFLLSVGTTYHNVIIYNRGTQSLDWEVNPEGLPISSYSASNVGTFTGIDRLYCTNNNSGGTSVGYLDNVTFSQTPEPSTLILLGAGAISLIAYAWRRRKLTV